MDAVKAFNAELCSLYDLKPPITKAKMTQITKSAIKAIKFYKHVVQSVERFIQKCRPEYKVPGLYVIDSIIWQSRRQFGADKDMFASRFSKNIVITFHNLFDCAAEDIAKMIRVLNLWQKNGVYLPGIIQPLLDLAADPHNIKLFETVQQQVEEVTGLVPSMPITNCDQKPPALTADALQLGAGLDSKVPSDVPGDLTKVVAQLMQTMAPPAVPQVTIAPQQLQMQLLQQLLLQQLQDSQQPVASQPPAAVDDSLLGQLQSLTQQLMVPPPAIKTAVHHLPVAVLPMGSSKVQMKKQSTEPDDEYLEELEEIYALRDDHHDSRELKSPRLSNSSLLQADPDLIQECNRRSSEFDRRSSDHNRDLSEDDQRSCEHNRDLSEGDHRSSEHNSRLIERNRRSSEHNHSSIERSRQSIEFNRRSSERIQRSSKQDHESSDQDHESSELDHESSEHDHESVERNHRSGGRNQKSCEPRHGSSERNHRSSERNQRSSERIERSSEQNRKSSERNQRSSERIQRSNERIERSSERSRRSSERNQRLSERNQRLSEQNHVSSERNHASIEQNHRSNERNQRSSERIHRSSMEENIESDGEASSTSSSSNSQAMSEPEEGEIDFDSDQAEHYSHKTISKPVVQEEEYNSYDESPQWKQKRRTKKSNSNDWRERSESRGHRHHHRHRYVDESKHSSERHVSRRTEVQQLSERDARRMIDQRMTERDIRIIEAQGMSERDIAYRSEVQQLSEREIARRIGIQHLSERDVRRIDIQQMSERDIARRSDIQQLSERDVARRSDGKQLSERDVARRNDIQQMTDQRVSRRIELPHSREDMDIVTDHREMIFESRNTGHRHSSKEIVHGSEDYYSNSPNIRKTKSSRREKSSKVPKPVERDDDVIIVEDDSDDECTRPRKKRRKKSRERTRSRSPESSREPSVEIIRHDKEDDRKLNGLPPIKPKHISICSTTLWIGHLTKQTTEEELQEELSKYGEATINVDRVKLFKLNINLPDKIQNLIPPRGCAFVSFNTRKEACKALDKLKNTILNGNNLKVAWAPGVGVKLSEFKHLYDGELGVTYIPWKKLPAESLCTLLDGGVVDDDSLPANFGSFIEKRNKKPEKNATRSNSNATRAASNVATPVIMTPGMIQMIPLPLPPVMPLPPTLAVSMPPPMAIPLPPPLSIGLPLAHVPPLPLNVASLPSMLPIPLPQLPMFESSQFNESRLVSDTNESSVPTSASHTMASQIGLSEKLESASSQSDGNSFQDKTSPLDSQRKPHSLDERLRELEMEEDSNDRPDGEDRRDGEPRDWEMSDDEREKSDESKRNEEFHGIPTIVGRGPQAEEPGVKYDGENKWNGSDDAIQSSPSTSGVNNIQSIASNSFHSSQTFENQTNQKHLPRSNDSETREGGQEVQNVVAEGRVVETSQASQAMLGQTTEFSGSQNIGTSYLNPPQNLRPPMSAQINIPQDGQPRMFQPRMNSPLNIPPPGIPPPTMPPPQLLIPPPTMPPLNMPPPSLPLPRLPPPCIRPPGIPPPGMHLPGLPPQTLSQPRPDLQRMDTPEFGSRMAHPEFNSNMFAAQSTNGRHSGMALNEHNDHRFKHVDTSMNQTHPEKGQSDTPDFSRQDPQNVGNLKNVNFDNRPVPGAQFSQQGPQFVMAGPRFPDGPSMEPRRFEDLPGMRPQAGPSHIQFRLPGMDVGPVRFELRPVTFVDLRTRLPGADQRFDLNSGSSNIMQRPVGLEHLKQGMILQGPRNATPGQENLVGRNFLQHSNEMGGMVMEVQGQQHQGPQGQQQHQGPQGLQQQGPQGQGLQQQGLQQLGQQQQQGLQQQQQGQQEPPRMGELKGGDGILGPVPFMMNRPRQPQSEQGNMLWQGGQAVNLRPMFGALEGQRMNAVPVQNVGLLQPSRQLPTWIQELQSNLRSSRQDGNRDLDKRPDFSDRSRDCPPRDGPPHVGLPRDGPPHVGPPRVGPPHVGPPRVGPPHDGPPRAGPPRDGPSFHRHDEDHNFRQFHDSKQFGAKPGNDRYQFDRSFHMNSFRDRGNVNSNREGRSNNRNEMRTEDNFSNNDRQRNLNKVPNEQQLEKD